MTLSKLVVLLSSLVASGALMAQTKAPEPDYTLSYNIGAVTDYRYRGISQSARKPALQGGVDFAHKSGFYLGTWASTIRWIKDTPPADKGSVEVDLYGGYKGAINDKLSYDVGGLYYWYVDNNYKLATGENANTFELYGALTYGPATVKYSHSLTNLFGTPDSKQSGYLDLGANVPVAEGLLLNLHVGRQRVKNNGALSYTDYKVGLTKDFGFASVSLAWIKANTSAYVSPTGRNLGKSAAVLSVSKTF